MCVTDACVYSHTQPKTEFCKLHNEIYIWHRCFLQNVHFNYIITVFACNVTCCITSLSREWNMTPYSALFSVMCSAMHYNLYTSVIPHVYSSVLRTAVYLHIVIHLTYTSVLHVYTKRKHALYGTALLRFSMMYQLYACNTIRLL